uniref:RNA-directed DNA polymerase, eukaryota, reverse transcriptase zinc-binding domain protein n=1 Tax=Tanacetum cinerariifolium TaxID=118510 RepID=A0A6L2P7K7_TANCI|nr:RNA-directed DNA polymerase, eukaryota, reverse transcriptase zinc-binding domain protein [Tanacetum cinerariifolium]
MDMYPRMYALECNKLSTLADKLNDPTFIQSFRRPPRGGLEEEQYVKLIDIVNSVNLSDSKDRWVWSLDSTGEFSINSAHLYIDDYFLPTVARLLISKVARWWELDIPDLLSYEDWLDWFNSLRLPKGVKDILEGIFYVK